MELAELQDAAVLAVLLGVLLPILTQSPGVLGTVVQVSLRAHAVAQVEAENRNVVVGAEGRAVLVDVAQTRVQDVEETCRRWNPPDVGHLVVLPSLCE